MSSLTAAGHWKVPLAFINIFEADDTRDDDIFTMVVFLDMNFVKT